MKLTCKGQRGSFWLDLSSGTPTLGQEGCRLGTWQSNLSYLPFDGAISDDK